MGISEISLLLIDVRLDGEPTHERKLLFVFEQVWTWNMLRLGICVEKQCSANELHALSFANLDLHARHFIPGSLFPCKS